VDFGGLYLERPFVRVTTALGSVTHNAGLVRFSSSYPNGRGCGPRCLSATILVEIPE
jgi:hypothetical protein